MKLRRRLSRHSADVVIGLLLAIVGAGLWELPAILLAIKLNVFAIPLALDGVLAFPFWVWYCISLMWASQLLYYSGTSVPEMIFRIRETSADVAIGAETIPLKTTESHEPE
ncbi:hypothetical protein CV102_16685 [Natronococcus pandeyae]|uniref:Uncharacterized protein n=1 Tax=Natronococcus pandeyae TaxID=2055836 RepID=A0A8J8Q001_9EURY|nr:hypothetical protein [Natronococcus pandeyae]TYL37595.1 hypothetical protein CV102_16685 [Natronococcus pandeyae]